MTDEDANPMDGLMQMAQDMSVKMGEAQAELESTELEGTSGGGLVKVTLNGHLHMVGLSVSPEAVDPADPSILEDLILAAWKDAHDQVAEVQAQANPLGGLGGLGGLGDLGGLVSGDLGGDPGIGGLLPQLGESNDPNDLLGGQ